MNISIKSLFIILITSIYFSFSISSTEIVITVPDQYNTKEMPLPPFPEEVVSELETVDHDIELRSGLKVRWVKQNSISYNYYTDFLKLNPPAGGYISNRFIIDSDFNDTLLTSNPEYKSNAFKISAEGEYDINKKLYDINFVYSEYRTLVDIVGSANYRDLSLSVLVGSRDYYNCWYINPVIIKDTVVYSGKISDKRYVRPYIQLYYASDSEYYGALAFGFNYNSGNMRGGVSIINRTMFPYTELYLSTGSFIANLETNVKKDNVDYLLEAGYRRNFFIKAGIGTELYTDYSYDPYISIKDNLFFGQREYKIYQDKFLFDLTVYRDSLLSVFTFGYERDKKMYFSLETGIYNSFSIKSSLDYSFDSEDFLINLIFEYKVGKI